MSSPSVPEVWLRGPHPDVPALLQPVAHALLQAREEVNALMKDFPDKLLWDRPVGLASVAFHLQHLTGVLDRLFTYAAGDALTAKQLSYLKVEGKSEPDITTIYLLTAFNAQVDTVIQQLIGTDEKTLTAKRGVGRAQLPSTVLGLMVHAAEHTMRHTGQLLVTVKVVTSV